VAVIKPFRAVRYNPQRIPDLQSVVSQPYDKIDEALREQYLALSPYNVVRIILNPPQPDDTPSGPNIYTRARDCYQQWLREGVLLREDRPAFYVYRQTFTVNGQTHTRQGLIAAVELVDFDQGIILPHERTHSGPKEDRLRLLETVQVNTEQIFLLYPDPDNAINHLIFSAIAARSPDLDVVEMREHDVRQQLWVLTDPAILASIQAGMAPLRGLIIADGHHRYSTGLTYRSRQRQAHPDAPPTAAFNFIQATLVSMNDPGLIVLPTHREICNFSTTSPAEVLRRAAGLFTITAVPDLPTCLQRVNAHPAGHAFGFYGGTGVGYHVLTLKATVQPDVLIPGTHSSAWKSLAVSILHSVLIERIAGVPGQGIEDQTMIRYHRDARQAVANIDAGRGDFAFFVSPTRLEQIKAIAAQGETMPQKSTDFYPKVISGLTMLPVAPEEHL
jgi:uncharacterized protein (DUF1015 family)